MTSFCYNILVNTREEILDHLAKRPYASAEDLAQVMAKTRSNLQYHLKRLEQTGVITPVYPDPIAGERGRPRRYFSLSQAERPNNLVMLVEVLLGYLQNLTVGPQGLENQLREIAHKMIARPGNLSSFTVRLNRLVRELSNHGYQARWEAHATGPEIVFRNCPYAALLPGHLELCRMDTLLLEHYLDQSMIHKARIQLPAISACRFSLLASGGEQSI